ncbi:ImmA/IrrE family metallo-endopeptidase [Mesorhizobium sp. LCM 4577]|uniref:ImmA/IrrE family metallo-endopeptidase n=1 Tax=Mesorhizobium sp. LCM 4577 TaxID=1848288 RepID=UPI00104244F2|nr:hypothetical protein [Mesorhizobium sp. LCM 4577]
MDDVFISRGASANKIRILAEWVRKELSNSNKGTFDIIRFIEIDLPKLFPGLYVHIESDNKMGSARAFVSEDPLGIVVSDSIYEGASNGCMFSAEIIMHEVGHLLLHHRYAALGLNSAAEPYQQRVEGAGFAHSAEWQATMFALCFLYPFSEFKKFTGVGELAKSSRLTHGQANRVLNHIKRLRVRQNYSDTVLDRSWLKGVTESFPKIQKARPSKLRSQLLLFFGDTRRARNVRRLEVGLLA